MTKITIDRTYAHKEFGEVGKVALVMDVREATLDGVALPPAAVEYLLHFSLQSLQDAYAGSKTADDATAAWGKKREALLAGTIGTRLGSGVSDYQKVARSVVRNNLRVAGKWEAVAKLGDKAATQKLDDIIAANAAALRPLVDKEIARRKAERETQLALARALTLDM